MKCSTLTRLIAVIAVLFATTADSYRILFLAPFPVPSHWLWLDHFVQELLARGHHVTALTSFRTKAPASSNYTELIIDPPADLQPASPEAWIFEGKYYNDLQNLLLLWKVGLLSTRHAFESKAGQSLLHGLDDREFDLVISEQFFQESFLLFGHKFKAPIVTISTYDLTQYLDESKGFRTPLSIVPHIMLPFTEDMSFSERLYNLFYSTVDKLIRQLYYLPMQNGMARHYFAVDAAQGTLPTCQEMESSIALTLFNGHAATSPPRPHMPSHIQVGGVHIKAPKPLPARIQQFLDGADHGVVYFSLGTHVKSSRMSADRIQAFVDVFKGLPQRVLWKFEEDSVPGLSSNVMLAKWIPQADVLAHPNVVLFINHGGVFGLQESVHNGVPMLAIPFYGDQFRNAKRAVKNGHALTIAYQDLNRATIEEKVTEMLSNAQYRRRAKEVAAVFNDNRMAPIEEAMYWIEYVARHKGAKHLHSKAIDMPWWRYHMIDVYAVIVASFFTLATISFVVMNKLLGKKKESVVKAKVKRN